MSLSAALALHVTLATLAVLALNVSAKAGAARDHLCISHD
jgi:hypothetical protein